MKSNIADIRNMDASELIRERARILARIRKFEKDELPSDAWLSEPTPDICYINDLERLIDICNLQIVNVRTVKK